MSTVNIPLTSDPWVEFSVSLEGVNYVFDVRWSERAGAWYLDVLNEDGDYLAVGRKLVCDFPVVGHRETNPDIFPGYLWIVDTSGQQIDPGPDDLGSRVLMYYEESV